MFQICGDVEAVGFPVQNVYKMTYGDKNATSEPLNLWTRERLPFNHSTTQRGLKVARLELAGFWFSSWVAVIQERGKNELNLRNDNWPLR